MIDILIERGRDREKERERKRQRKRERERGGKKTKQSNTEIFRILNI